MAVNYNTTYNVGGVKKTQSNLNNNMSGTDANAIYYATHNGTGNSNYMNGNSQSNNNGSYVTYEKVGGTNDDDVVPRGSGGSGSTLSGLLSGAGSYGASGGNATTAASRPGSGSGGSGGSAGGAIVGGATGGGFDYMSMIEEMLAKQRAAAENAYNNSKSRLDQALSATQGSIKDNLNSTLDQLQSNYDFNEKKAQGESDRAMREAYINYMMNKKNLNQNLSAAGISGGATESSLAKLFNNYGSSRNNIENTLADNLAMLKNTLENNIASANQAYNSQFADTMNNYNSNLAGLETALANNLMSNYSGSSLSSLANYAATLNNLLGQQNVAMASYVTPENSLAVDNLSTQQANNMGTVTDYAKYLASLQNQAQQQAQNIIQSGLGAGNGVSPLAGLLGR